MLVFAFLFAFCSLGATQSSIEQGISNFAFDFYKESARAHPGDIVISPLSVASVLTLLSQAANGTTFDQIQKGLNLYNIKAIVADQYNKLFGSLQQKNGGPTLDMVNQIYVQQGHEINSHFSEIAKDKFSAGIEALNFDKSESSAKSINDFVKSKTNQKIQEIVKSGDLNRDTEMVLLNAIYFKATWETKFQKNLTTKGTFYTSKNDSISVEYMNVKAYLTHGIWTEFNSSVLELRYANSTLSFVIVLPERSASLSTLENLLTYKQLNRFLDSEVDDVEVNATIPRFSIETEIDLKSTFENMGMGEMFKSTPDLSGLFKTPKDLRVSKAVHKAVIEVNEEGSEASAATGLTIMNRSGFAKTEIFVADHPFLYFIRDTKAKVIIFAGRVDNFASKPKDKPSGSTRLSISYAFLVTILLFWTFTTQIRI